MSGQPLPRPNPYATVSEPIFYQAYDRCLDFEENHAKSLQSTSNLPVLICSRFLGYLIHEAPTMPGREMVCVQVMNAKDDEDLQRLAEKYVNYFILCWRTPIPDTDYGSDSGSDSGDELPTTLPNILSRERAIQDALKRDGYRCLITKEIDFDSLEAGLVDVSQRTDRVTSTVAAHIFDGSASTGSPALGFIERYGQISRLEDDKVDLLENLLTLGLSLRRWFNSLWIWFERKPQDPLNEYRLQAVEPALLRGVETTLRLTTPDQIRYPLPDPRYLALHAACARVAHLSGAADYITMVLYDLEERDISG